MKDSQELQLKKLTLIAWTKVLLKKGIIDISKHNRMITAIEQLKT